MVKFRESLVVGEEEGRFGEEMNRAFVMEELEEGLRKLKREKAEGFDEVKNELVKCSGPEFRGLLLIYLNDFVKRGEVLASLNNGRVSLLFKAGDRRKAENYRPITVSSCFLKLFSVLYNMRLTEILEREGVLQESQFGFRKWRSTVEAVWLLNQQIYKARGRGKGLYLGFVDLSKVRE